MSDRHFKCTACGQCCFGWLPLTLNDALTHSTRFPLALVWTPVPQNTKIFSLIAQLGITIKLRNRKQIAVLITPTAYIPPSFPCPELTTEGLCNIHVHKPLRCRTMPFYPYRDEQDQAQQLIPRQDWLCDISASAPIVYYHHRIIERDDFDRERQELLQQVPTIRIYANYMLKYMPWISDNLVAVMPKSGGTIITSLSSFLTAIQPLDVITIAMRQLAIYNQYAVKTANIPELDEYQRNYVGWAKEMEYLATSSSNQ